MMTFDINGNLIQTGRANLSINMRTFVFRLENS